MLNLTGARIWLAIEPTDMRKSFDTLAAVMRENLQADPLSDQWFVFRGKQADRLKILYWDGDGFALWQKRLLFLAVTGLWPRWRASLGPANFWGSIPGGSCVIP